MIHLILVHGTWAKRAKWVEEGGKVDQAIRSALHAKGTVEKINTVPFRWNGRNSFTGRAEAIDDLKTELQNISVLDPDAKIYIVGHSHGGNVALQAASAVAESIPVHGVICLATPVLTGKALRLHWYERLSHPKLLPKVAEWVMFFLIIMGGIFGPLIVMGPHFTDYLFLQASAVLIFILANRLLWSHVKSKLLQRLKKTKELVTRTTGKISLNQQTIIFVRHPGDEASGGIGTASTLDWLMGKLSTVAGFLPRIVRIIYDFVAPWVVGPTRTRKYRVFRFCLYVFCLVVAALNLIDGTDATQDLGILLGKVFLAILAPFIACSVLLAVSYILLLCFKIIAVLLLALAMGRELLLVSHEIKVTAESSPAGTWLVTTIYPADDKAPKPHSLKEIFELAAHSSLHIKPEFHRFVANWIAERHHDLCSHQRPS